MRVRELGGFLTSSVAAELEGEGAEIQAPAGAASAENENDALRDIDFDDGK